MTASDVTAADEIDFDLADKIEAAFDSKPADYFWAMWELARATGAERHEIAPVIRWMLKERYAKVNGRGGAWEKFATAKYRPFGDAR